MTMASAGSHFEPKPSILVVDDSSDDLALMFGLLRSQYTVRGANNGKSALKVARGGSPPDLILLDIMMPRPTGYEVCEELKSDSSTRDVPVIFLTALTESAEEYRGLRMGAVDYITKPVHPEIFLSRVKVHLQNRAAKEFLRDQNARLEHQVKQRTRELLDTQDATIVILASLVEARDNETGNHIRRTQHYVRALARQLQTHPLFSDYLSDHQIDILFKSAPLHDIGKIGIPDSILLKAGRLNPEEFEIMKTHTTLGHKAIEDAEAALGMKVEFLACAKEIALTHQEMWNGNGYPRKLAGNAIPISGRLMAVADVYDALRNRRVYKPAFPHDQATALILEGRGGHFDPDVVDAFAEISDQFAAIADRYLD
jgi:putative two-component system response regulator